MRFCIHVVDDDNDSLRGIDVTVDSNEETTDEDGNAWFDLEIEEGDSVSLYIDGEDYGEINPEEGESYTYQINDGEDSMDLTVNVVDDDGEPLKGVRVAIFYGTDKILFQDGSLTDFTDEDGNAHFTTRSHYKQIKIYVDGDEVDTVSNPEDGDSYTYTLSE